MATPGLRDEPKLTPDERQERSSLDFYLAELGRLRDRGFLAPEAFETVAAETRSRQALIERRAVFRADLEAARRIKEKYPREALEHAENARQAEPAEREPWLLAIQLHRRLGDDPAALAVCEEANARFNLFGLSVEQLRAEIDAKTSGPEAFPIEQARAALKRGEFDEVARLCNKRLATQPDHYDATVLLAFARQRQGRVGEALELYRKLRRFEPGNSTWTQWVETLEHRTAMRPVVLPEATPIFEPAVALSRVEPEAPRLSWSSVAGEFLQDHWQKLILCLAVLLIVVSSNVAASQLLGPKLWSPVGKCLLALVYTVMFAGLGAGLVRWGAERAGRIMLLTTLIVVPADFMLAGQMKLLTAPSAFGLAVLGIDAAALFVVIWWVARALRLGRLAGFLSVALFALSAFNAASPPGEGWPWGWKFGLFLMPAGVFLGSVVWLLTRPREDLSEDRLEATYFGLGLLAFAFLTGTIRTGVFGLDLLPTLYALPVMACALTCVVTSANLESFDADPKRKQWLRFAGLVFSGLAIALALARPPGPSPLFSGNTLATALLGLGLYAVLLGKERKPAYLYFAFGALIVSYFGAFYFAKDLMHAVEEVVRRGMGYEKKLPEPFRAINGLVFSPLLAGLSIYFRRVWRDERLSRHCHYLGVPFSIGACVFSGFEPKAAVICLSGYALLYAVAVRVFATPWVTYLATAALTAAAHFGIVAFRPETTMAEEALGASALGLGFWLIVLVLRLRGVGIDYRRPVDRSSMALEALAVVGALISMAWPTVAVSYAAAGTFLVVALTAILVNRDEPAGWLGWTAVVAGNAGLSLGLFVAGLRGPGGLSYAQFAMESAALGFLGAFLAEGLKWLGPKVGRPARLVVYPAPLSLVAFVPMALAVLFCVLHVERLGNQLTTGDFLTMGAASLCAGLGLAILTRPFPMVALAHLSLACGLGVWVCAAQAVHGQVLDGPDQFGAVCAAFAVGLIALEELAQGFALKRKGIDPDFRGGTLPIFDLFAKALPGFEVALVLFASALAISGFTNSPMVIFTYAAGAVAMLWATRLRRSERLVDLAIVLAIAAAGCLSGWLVGWANLGWGIAWLALTAAVVSLTLRTIGWFCTMRGSLALYVKPCSRAAALTTWPVMALAILGSFGSSRGYQVGVAALGINTLTLALIARDRQRALYTYRGIASAVIAVYVIVLSVGKADPDSAYILGLVAVLLAFVLSAIGFVVRRGATVENALERIYALPLFRSAVVLTTLAIVPAYGSPVTMVLVGFSYLVMVKGLPTRNWLYATVGAWACGVFFGILDGQGGERLVTAAMVGAYQLWLIGLLVRRAEPALVRWLHLNERDYDYPFFNTAAVSCAFAVIQRISDGWYGPMEWSDSAPLAMNVAGFLVLMIKPYPHVGWLHAALGLATLSAGLAAYPSMGTGFWWLPLGMTLANGWSVLARVFRRYESPVCKRLGIDDEEYSAVVALWSKATFALATMATALLVFVGVIGALAEQIGPSRPGEWSGVLLAIGLGCVYLFAQWWDRDHTAVAMGLGSFGVLAVWWLAAPWSPLPVAIGISARVDLPIETAVMALAAVAAALWGVNRPGWRAVFWRLGPDADERARLDAFAMQGGLALAILAAIFTRGAVNTTTVATLLLATAAPALAAIGRGWIDAAYAASLGWSATALFAALEVSRRLGVSAVEDQSVMVAVAVLIAAGVLWTVAGFSRRQRGPVNETIEPVQLPAGSIALALEQVALLGGVVVALAVAASCLGEHNPSRWATAAGVGALFGLALLAIGLIARWGSEWLVYAAQGAILAGYLDFRRVFSIGSDADALVLTLFGYLDLGLAEVMHRVGLGKFARPTRYFSLALPVIPLVLGLIDEGLDGLRLVYLFTAATFYGIAGVSMRWKPLGYAAAVLYNAFLWLLWSRIGFELSDRPQFFLMPVALSAILFAEVERSTLGREAANLVRGLGLSVMYLSLAFPVWQFASLGAWVTLLLVFLTGIFVGIGLRVQVFLWLGLAGFVMDVVYQLGRMGMQDTLVKWAIMLMLGILLILFVALNETKKIVPTMRAYLDQARQWD